MSLFLCLPAACRNRCSLVNRMFSGLLPHFEAPRSTVVSDYVSMDGTQKCTAVGRPSMQIVSPSRCVLTLREILSTHFFPIQEVAKNSDSSDAPPRRADVHGRC